MATRHHTYTLDEVVLSKLDWLMKNSVQANKSRCIADLIEKEYLRQLKLKLEREGGAGCLS